MVSSRSSGRGHRRRMKKKQAKKSKTERVVYEAQPKTGQPSSKTERVVYEAQPKTGQPSKTASKQSKTSMPEPQGFVPTARDLVSNDAVWNLYERWCIFYDQRRTKEEKEKRFNYFKKDANKVFSFNETFKYCDPPCFQVLSKYSDKSADERPRVGKIPYRPSKRVLNSRKPKY